MKPLNEKGQKNFREYVSAEKFYWEKDVAEAVEELKKRLGFGVRPDTDLLLFMNVKKHVDEIFGDLK